jgi:hypothetical protein
VREDDVEALLRAAYLKGWEQSAEGYNAEHRPDAPETADFIGQMIDDLCEVTK